MGIASLATGVATGWLAKKAVEGIGLDLTKVANHVVDDVVDLVSSALPGNPNIGRIINTTA